MYRDPNGVQKMNMLFQKIWRDLEGSNGFEVIQMGPDWYRGIHSGPVGSKRAQKGSKGSRRVQKDTKGSRGI